MTGDVVSYSLLTHVLEARHCKILEDWLAFFDTRPHTLIVVTGDDPSITDRLHALCNPLGIEVLVTDHTNPHDLKTKEPVFLERQVRASAPGLLSIVKLDTLPRKRRGLLWMADTVAIMKRENALFASGSNLPRRTDIHTDDPRFMLTQEVSNNFQLVDRDTWLLMQEAKRSEEAKVGRYINEYAINEYCKEHGRYGIRLINSRQFVVVHTQEWGQRMDMIRRLFQLGIGIDSFIHGYEEDKIVSVNRWYMHPDSMPIKRARIHFGRWRREMWQKISGP